MKNGNTPVIGVIEYDEDGNGRSKNALTKREHFAAMAMQGLLSSTILDSRNGFTVNDGYIHVESIASESVKLADALLKELEK